jgi:general secretion pathway protein D
VKRRRQEGKTLRNTRIGAYFTRRQAKNAIKQLLLTMVAGVGVFQGLGVVEAQVPGSGNASRRPMTLPPSSQPSSAQNLPQNLPQSAPQSLLQSGNPAAGEAKLQVYALPTEYVAYVVGQLQAQFGADKRVRITTEPETGRLMVLAPESTQRKIAESVAGITQQLSPVATDVSGHVLSNSVQSRQYKLQKIGWRELEDAISRIAGAKLTVSTTNNGEVAQLQLMTDAGPREIMTIDRRRDEVRMQGSPKDVLAWTQVVTAVDMAQADPQRPTQIVPINPATPERIETALRLVRLASYQQPPQDEQVTGQLPADAQDDNSPGMAVGSPDSLSSGTGLIGDVDISFVPEMGLVIVKGGKRDVARVLEVIDQIKKQSAETQPEIEVYPLKHVNGVALEPVLKDLNDKVFSPRQGQISLYALGQPNSLLLIGRPEALTGIKELIGKLDQPLDPNNQLRVFRLVNSSAVDAETIVRNFFGDISTQATGGNAAAAGTQLNARVKVVADYRTNSLIVQASPRDIAEVARLILEIDVESTPAENEIRVFPVKNAVASELQPILQSAITGSAAATTGQGGAPGGQQQATGGTGNSRAPSSRLMVVPREGDPVNSGILAGVTITSNPSINALVVRAPSKSMPLIQALIEQLDQLPSADARIKVYPVINGDATSLANTLQQIFGLPATAGTNTNNAATALGLQNLAALTGGGEGSLVQLRISVDTRTNSIIASGAPSDLEVIEALLYRLDETGGQQRNNEVVWLRNANAIDVFNALNTLLTNQRTVITQQLVTGQAISLFERIDREVFVVSEPSTNSLIISATPRYMQQIKQVIERLDRQQPMIAVEILIAEVTLDDAFDIGTELGLQDSLLFDRNSATGGTLNSPAFNLGTPFGLNQPQRRPQNVAGQGLSSFAMGRSNADLGYGGLVLAASSESVGLLFRMLQDANRVQILSRPSLMTIDNNISVVNVGQSVPTLTGTTNGINGVTTGVNYVNTGLTMQIQPRTNQDGLINMIVAVSRSNIDPSGGIPIGFQIDGQGNSQPISAPIFNQTLAQTRVTAYDGQTVILGGLITKERATRSRRIPFLADIPLAGWLFRYDSETERRTELLVVMTPRVINYNDPNKLDMIKQVESSRMSWCLADILNVYGDVGLSEGNGLWGPAASPVIYPDTNPTGDVGRSETGGNIDGTGAPTYMTPSFDNVPQPLAPQSIPTVGNWNGEVQVGPYGAQSNGNVISNGAVISNGTVISNGAVISNGSAVPNGQFAPSNQFVPSNQYSPNGQPVGNGQYAPGAVLMGEEESTLILQQEVPQGSVPQRVPQQVIPGGPTSSRQGPKTLLRNGVAPANSTTVGSSNNGSVPNNYQPITIAPSPYVVPAPNMQTNMSMQTSNSNGNTLRTK